MDLKIYNILGKEVATLVNEKQIAGKYTKAFTANGLASSIYLYRITAGENVTVKKMNLVK